MVKDNHIVTLEPGVDVIRDKYFRYRIVYNIKKDNKESFWKKGNKRLFNLLTGGSWGNLLFVLGLVAIAFILVYTYKADVSSLVECCNSAVRNVTEIKPLIFNLTG